MDLPDRDGLLVRARAITVPDRGAAAYRGDEPAGNQRPSRAYSPADQGHACRADGKLKVSASGDYPGAAQALDQAADIYRDIGSQGGEAEVLNERGTLHRISGDLAQAEGCHRQALDLARAIASSRAEAHALAGLGRSAVAAGHATQAEVFLRQALEIFQRIGAAEAPDLLAEIYALTDPRPTGEPWQCGGVRTAAWSLIS